METKQQRFYKRHREREIKRVQEWRKNNQEKYKQLNRDWNKKRDRRAPEIKFLQSIGYDQKLHTIRKENNKFRVLGNGVKYILYNCGCGSKDCKGFALVEDNETQINLFQNIMGMDFKAPGQNCITRRLT